MSLNEPTTSMNIKIKITHLLKNDNIKSPFDEYPISYYQTEERIKKP